VFDIQQTTVFEKWQARLKDKRAEVQLVLRLERLAFGHFGDAKSVGEGVAELRIHCGPGYRVYLTRRGDKIVLLLCAGTKGTQMKDILQAKRLAREWRDSDGIEDN
jgi:putative addiction module killer protein